MASDDNLLNDDEIQKLLNSAEGDSSAPSPAADIPTGDDAAGAAKPADSSGGASPVSSSEVEAETDELLNKVEAGLSAALSENSSSGNVVGGLDAAVPFELSSFDDAGKGDSEQRFSLGTLDDVELELQIELGRAELLIEEVLALREGAVVPLDKLAGDPVDILVNGRLLARGEVLVLNDNFCVRVAEIVSPDF